MTSLFLRSVRDLCARPSIHRVLAASATLACLLVIVIAGVRLWRGRAIERPRGEDLQVAHTVVGAFHDQRGQERRAVVALLVESPRLKAVVSTPGLGQAVLRDSAQSAQQASHSDLLLLCDGAGRLLASATEPARSGEVLADHPAVASALRGELFEGIWAAPAGVYHVVASPVRAGERVVGAVIAGASMTRRMMEVLRDMTRCQVALMSPQRRVLASSADELFAELQQEMPPSAVAGSGQAIARTLDGTRYLLSAVPVAEDQAWYLLARPLREEAQPQRWGWVLLIGVALLIWLLVLRGLSLSIRPPQIPTQTLPEETGVPLTGGAAVLISVDDLERALQDLPAAVVVLTTQGHVEMANPAACQLLGYDAEELRGQPFTHLVATEDTESPQGTALTRSGVRIPVSVSRSVIRDQEGRPQRIVGIIQHLGEQEYGKALKHAYTELNRQYQDLQQLVLNLKRSHEVQDEQRRSALATGRVVKKILLIDDDVALCKLVKLNLERSGYDVTTAHLGQEGLEKAKTDEFDLVITDFLMPDMNGDAVLNTLKTVRPELPVVLFSIYHDHDPTITPEMRGKADGIIGKPIDHDELHRVIEHALAKRRAEPRGR